jgi:UDP-glucose 4-epimerase
MKANILVTGGAGFIGSHVVRDILSEADLNGSKIVVLDDLSGGFSDNVADDPRVTFVEGSITDEILISNLFERYKFCFVYHLAAYAAEGLSHFIRRFNYTNNLIGSVNLINGAANYGCECFVFTSSIAVYGAGQVPMREDMVPQPEDPYGIAKYAVELDLKNAHRMFGLNYVIFRPHNVYGEYQNIGDKYRNVVGIFMNQILQGMPMTIFGDGEQQRAFSYIGDIAPIIACAPVVKGAQNRVFNIGADKPYSVNELALRVSKAMKMDPRLVHLPSRNEVCIAFSDHSACRDVFGSIPQTPLDEGLAKMAAWVKTVGSRRSKEFKDIEIKQGLPPSWKSIH